MSGKTTKLSHAAVDRLARVEKGLRIREDAVDLVIVEAEEYIKEIFTGALLFTKHRGGTMIMKEDVVAYLNSLKK